MILARNLFFLFSLTLLSVAATTLNMFNYNPYEVSTKIFIYFYISFSIALASIISLVVYLVKIKFLQASYITCFWPSTRQGVILSVSVTILLILKGLKLLDFWIGIPLALAVVLLEFFFQTNPKSKKALKG